MADSSLLTPADTINRRTLLGRGAALMGGLFAGLAIRPGRAYGQMKSTAGNRATTITQLADFVYATRFNDLPESVVSETKRLLLDSIGCALAGVASDKGKWGIEYVRAFFAGSPQATVIGFGDRVSLPGATFINAELINSLDHDATMLPGHVSPYVIPPVLAVAEQKKVSGKELITACALAHELGNRIGASLGTFRDVVDGGKASFPPIDGYSACVFGGAAAVAKLEQLSKDKLAQAMGLAGYIAPMQSHTTMIKNVPPTTAKNLLAGWAAQAQITAAYLVKAGHRGDANILDGDWGFWRFAGAAKWDAAAAVAALGKEWRFHKTIRYKAYPCCGILRGGLDCLAAIIEKNNLRSREIDGIHAYIEPSCIEPVFNNRDINNQVDAQFSVAYNLSVLSFGITPGIRWHEWDTMNNPEILRFMSKITFEPHPGYDAALKKNSQARIAKVVLSARGKTFVEERAFAKGSPSPDPSTYMTDADLMAKFKGNASRILPPDKINEACKQLMELDSVNDVSATMQLLRL
jgi:2-methylcitrate dehydratase PrpD